MIDDFTRKIIDLRKRLIAQRKCMICGNNKTGIQKNIKKNTKSSYVSPKWSYCHEEIIDGGTIYQEYGYICSRCNMTRWRWRRKFFELACIVMKNKPDSYDRIRREYHWRTAEFYRHHVKTLREFQNTHKNNTI